MIISDAHAGLVTAVRECFVGTVWQRCTVHFLRNIIDVMPKKNSEKERTLLKKIFRSSTMHEAKERKKDFEESVQDNPRYQKALAKLDAGFSDAIQYTNEPEPYQVSLRTTNSLERLNREIRRREKVISIFPNTDSAVRLIGAVLMEIDEKWTKSKRKFLYVDKNSEVLK